MKGYDIAQSFGVLARSNLDPTVSSDVFDRSLLPGPALARTT